MAAVTHSQRTNEVRPLRLAALLACHNRRASTVACLERLYAQDCFRASAQQPSRAVIEVFLVDDGSTDGTRHRVHDMFPEVTIIPGSGTLYWAGGMRLAWRTAAGIADHDGYLLLNDDTMLSPTGLSALLAACDFMHGLHGTRGIAVGSVTDECGHYHYGGSLWWKERRPVEPDGIPRPCDLFNCNATLISRDAYLALGIFRDVFTHSMADYEYACRARRAKVPCYVASEYVGTCRRNPTPPWLDSRLPLRERWRLLQSPKGLPFREYRHLCKAMYPWLWPMALAATYVRLMLRPWECPKGYGSA